MYTKYNLICTYSLFLGDPEKRLNPENLFLNSRSRFFRLCFPSPMLSSVNSFFPFCQLILSVVTTAPAQLKAEVWVAFWNSLSLTVLHLAKSRSVSLQTCKSPGYAEGLAEISEQVLSIRWNKSVLWKTLQIQATLNILTQPVFHLITESRLGH